MDFDDTPDEASFRSEVRTWLDAYLEPPAESNAPVSLFAEDGNEPELLAEARHAQEVLAEGGWGAITWPAQYGGRNASLVQSIIFQEELSRFGIQQRFFAIGLSMVGPTIITHGSDAQKQRYLPPMVTGQEVWCQLWSEPSAGSDLASITSTAVLNPDGENFTIQGHKVWTSGAHYSDFGLGLFRTGTGASRRQGISALVVDMKAPGVTIRPLRQMTGGANFNEVFFDDMVVGHANLIGEINGGWEVARTTMMNERLAVGGAISPSSAFPMLIRLARIDDRRSPNLVDDPVLRQDLARVFTLGRLFDLTYARVRTKLARGELPGSESSIMKLAAAHCWTRQSELALRVLGPAATLSGADAPESGRWQQAFLGSPAVRIGGGTDEIQANIIAERVLGLPREP